MTKKKKKKKRSSKFLGKILSGDAKKKVVQKFRQKFGPPVCEVLDALDPLVVRGFLPSAIALSRLRHLIPISPPQTKNTRPISPPKLKILEPPLKEGMVSIRQVKQIPWNCLAIVCL